MKKLLFFLLSVVLIGSVGCGSNKDLSMEVTDAGSTEVVNETSEPTTEAVTAETEDTENVVPESTEAIKEMETSDDKKETDKCHRKPCGLCRKIQSATDAGIHAFSAGTAYDGRKESHAVAAGSPDGSRGSRSRARHDEATRFKGNDRYAGKLPRAV